MPLIIAPINNQFKIVKILLDPKTKKPTRIGHTTNKAGKKVRFAKKSNENLD